MTPLLLALALHAAAGPARPPGVVPEVEKDDGATCMLAFVASAAVTVLAVGVGVAVLVAHDEYQARQ